MDAPDGLRLTASAAAAMSLALVLAGTTATPDALERVLFVGNSLTSVNNVPALVEALSRAGGDSIECRAVTVDGFSLEDHWNRGDAKRTIAQGGWTTVVLQQGPSALPESRTLLREFTRRFDAEIRRAGARTALYMVWPSRPRAGDFNDVSKSYADAARDVRGLVMPAGEAWRAAWRRDKTLALYGRDGFHPTPLGSYLAALVIYQALSGHSPVGLPAALRSESGAFGAIAITPSQAALAQQAAAEANAAFGNR